MNLRFLLCLLALITCFSASAERLALDRLNADPALGGAGMRKLKVSPDGSRVTFLRGRSDNQFQFDLWEFNLATKSMRRLVDARALVPNEQLSEAEKARRERERVASLSGILEYSWAPDGKQLLVPLAGDLYLVDLAAPDKARKVASGSVVDPKISPMGRYVSFVRDQNLFALELATGTLRQLTQDGKGTVHNGEAEFIAQEEMEQTTGYYWAPDDSAIAFKRYDEATVPLVQRVEIYADHTSAALLRYPAAGATNAQVDLMIVAPGGGAARRVDLGSEKDIYLVRADWTVDASELFFQRQTRDQKRIDLVAVNAATLAQRTVLSESAPTWVAIHDDLRFLKHSKQFIWASERSGRKHLYLYGLDGTMLHPISSGEWGMDEVLAVDEKGGKVFVASNRDAVVDKQVYALALDGSAANAPRRITSGDGWHEASFSERGEVFIDTFSDPSTPPQIALRGADGGFIEWLDHNEVRADHPYARYMADHLRTEFGSLRAEDGQALYYSIIKPSNFDPKHRYPVYLSMYGGPHSQYVARRWGNMFDQYMAQQGYVVFRLDNRGSSRRERKFTDVIYQNLGQHEVRDQLVGIDWLGRQSFVDARRIGVYGWSYGGFMALRMLEAASDKIAAGVSGAPVTDWALYDTHYTEQFMGAKPADAPQAYRQSGVFEHLAGLRAPLLLMHGMADDNVMFTNSTRLIDALVNRNVQFELMTYPGAKHGVSSRAGKRHVYSTIDAFFRRHLGAGAAPAATGAAAP
jgi:dipeptidyl-peptidase-4